MSCDDVAAAILDEGLPRPPEFQAHLEQCPRCRELAGLQASASMLRLPVPPPLTPVPRQSILGEVRRRQHRRRAVAGVAVLGAVATLVLFVVPRQAPTVPVAEVPLESVVSEAVKPEPATSEPVDIWPSLALLIDEVESYSERDLAFNDETYAPFGALALWVRPPEPIALNDRPFRTALAPLHPSPIQEPAR
jgi:hypothetical protein